MAKFVFKLQPMLNIKKQMEDSIKTKLGEAIQVLEAEKIILEELKNQKKKCMSEVSTKVSGGVTIDKLRNYNAYISFIKQKIINQSERVKSAGQIVDKYREELIEAVKERKMLETLKEKQYSEYLKEEHKKEQKLIDEVISYKESTNKKINR